MCTCAGVARPDVLDIIGDLRDHSDQYDNLDDDRYYNIRGVREDAQREHAVALTHEHDVSMIVLWNVSDIPSETNRGFIRANNLA